MAGSNGSWPSMVRRSLLVDRLGEVLALGVLVEDVLAVDVGAGAFEVVLGLGDPVVGDRRDGGLKKRKAARPVLSGDRRRGARSVSIVARMRPSRDGGQGERRHRCASCQGGRASPSLPLDEGRPVPGRGRGDERAPPARHGRPGSSSSASEPRGGGRAATSWSSSRPNSRSTSM